MKAYPTDADERLLIEEAQRDASRFGALYERYFDRVYAFIVSRVHDRDVAEDLTSQTFHSGARESAEIRMARNSFLRLAVPNGSQRHG